jgi:hypothetical protein
MTNTLKVSTDLYTKPGLNALGGARWSYRTIALLTTDLITTQIYAFNILPAGHRLVNAFVETASLDSGGTAAALCFSIGILNTYFGQAAATAAIPAAYSSGGVTDTSVDPQLVSGQNLMTTLTVGQAGGRVGLGVTTATTMTLKPMTAIGVDKVKDRIIAFQVTTLPNVALAGSLTLAIEIDRDQE